ncbi:hypothetical protein MMC10_006694 [Thelotrema lepadinum]|nr:hypothetical protein [Thelotrema lepadinum]
MGNLQDQVTDARELRAQGPPSRPVDLLRRQSSRFITVDNVLQYASDIPSAQQRFPSQRPSMARTKSGRPAAPRLAGRTVQSNIPARSTKVSEKLVLLPETPQTEAEIQEKEDFDEDNELAPERDDEEEIRTRGHRRGKSYAERLPKSRRAEKLPRVTAYCTAQSYRLKATAAFLKDQHGARTKLYDDCLYVVFQLPLLPGTGGYRVCSSPLARNSGGKTTLDEAIERSEARDYGEGFFEDAEQFSIRGEEGESPNQHTPPETDSRASHGMISPETGLNTPSSALHHQPDALSYAELYIFTYGIAVFWNFSASQEKDVLADLTFHSTSTTTTTSIPPPILLTPHSKEASPSPSTPNTPLMTPLPTNPSDFETEEFHFCYSPSIPRPRVFNDMITLRSGDHMIKLTISHAIAQSTKLSSFEQQMANQMAEAQHVPRRLALTGRLGLTRKQVVRILGAMYRSRVDVNLSSNVLDTPSFFWESEPTLHPLYAAVREYLEIGPRVKVLNERCRVFLDLAEILSDSIADTKMSTLTWIVIALIAVSILVTVTEVFLRFGLLHARKGNGSESEVVWGEVVNGSCFCGSGGGSALSSSGDGGVGGVIGVEGEHYPVTERVWSDIGSPDL